MRVSRGYRALGILEKDTVTWFEPACKAVDTAFQKLAAAKDDPKKRVKAEQDFDAAVVKLKAAFNKVSKFTGLSISVKQTPKEALNKAAFNIVKAAEGAKAQALG